MYNLSRPDKTNHSLHGPIQLEGTRYQHVQTRPAAGGCATGARPGTQRCTIGIVITHHQHLYDFFVSTPSYTGHTTPSMKCIIYKFFQPLQSAERPAAAVQARNFGAQRCTLGVRQRGRAAHLAQRSSQCRVPASRRIDHVRACARHLRYEYGGGCRTRSAMLTLAIYVLPACLNAVTYSEKRSRREHVHNAQARHAQACSSLSTQRQLRQWVPPPVARQIMHQT